MLAFVFPAYSYVGDSYVTPDSWSRHVNANGIKASLNGLSFASIDDYNDFGQPEKVTLRPFDGAKSGKNAIKMTLPAKSIVTITFAL